MAQKIDSEVISKELVLSEGLPCSFYVLGSKEVCNRGVACNLLKLDGSWQATPSMYYKIPLVIYHQPHKRNYPKYALGVGKYVI